MKRPAGCVLDVAGVLIVACALAASPARLFTSGHGAIALGQISVKGRVAINGVTAIGGASVFSGDRVTTRERSAASVFMKSGDELVLGELTSVAIVDEQGEITVPLAGGQLEYLSGPELPVVVTARGTKIIPSAGGVYSVVLRGDALRVTATKGFAEFESANGKVKVAEGKTLLATLETAGAGSATMRSRGRIIKYVITVAAIAGGGGLGLELVRSNSGCTVSPSKTGDCASH